MPLRFGSLSVGLFLSALGLAAWAQDTAPPRPVVVRAARMLDVKAGKLVPNAVVIIEGERITSCLLYTSPSPRDMRRSRMPSSA